MFGSRYDHHRLGDALVGRWVGCERVADDVCIEEWEPCFQAAGCAYAVDSQQLHTGRESHEGAKRRGARDGEL